MAKSENQRAKLLYILKILMEETDDTTALTAQDLIDRLAKYEIKAERKSIYSDIDTLILMGYDILKDKSKDHNGYYMASREFELAELKLLVDAVASSKFITEKKSKELISKIETLCAKNEAKQLQRQVYVSDRLKTENESVYYSVDGIHDAILNDRQISFLYYEWDTNKKMRFRKNGERYQISPYLLVWNDSNYYLVAYDQDAAIMKHYRVDKMFDIQVEKHTRLGKDVFKEFTPANYAGKNFGMFGGEEEILSLECEEFMIGVLIDRFGKEISIRPASDGFVRVRVAVCVSHIFFGWLAGLQGKVRIVAPESVAIQAKEYLRSVCEKWDS